MYLVSDFCESWLFLFVVLRFLGLSIYKTGVCNMFYVYEVLRMYVCVYWIECVNCFLILGFTCLWGEIGYEPFSRNINKRKKWKLR